MLNTQAPVMAKSGRLQPMSAEMYIMLPRYLGSASLTIKLAPGFCELVMALKHRGYSIMFQVKRTFAFFASRSVGDVAKLVTEGCRLSVTVRYLIVFAKVWQG